MENDQPEEELHLANHQLISVLNNSPQIYQKVQIEEDEGRNQMSIKI